MKAQERIWHRICEMEIELKKMREEDRQEWHKMEWYDINQSLEEDEVDRKRRWER